MKLVEGLLKDQYNRLWSYAKELLKSNQGSSVVINVNRPSLQVLPIFKRMYVCFNGCKKGFMEWYRPSISLDGYFLKRTHRGQLLAVVAKDGNNCMFPITFVVVESKIINSWTWFVDKLIKDLRLISEHGWSFISNQQKVW